MKCKCCGAETAKGVKIRGGHICEDCLEKLPQSIMGNPALFNKKQIKRLVEVFSETCPPRKSDIAIGDGTRFCVCKDFVFINRKRLYYKDIDTIRLVYHPLEDAGDGKVYVRACAAIRIKKMSGEFETVLNERSITKYTIDGNSITYEGYQVLPEIIEEIRKALRTGTNNIGDYIKAKEEKEEREFWEERDRMWKEYEERTRREERFNREEAFRGKKEDKSKKNADSALEAAMRLFSVTMPFSMEQIKKERNRLLKKYHPDEAGGSTRKSVEINQAFDLLKKFAE